ncbi:hypothetical protein F5Y05DRAFT_248178 [Hypoxylon sp. FL0543]|nr:hypothetical protein F5Y05DRAFT_248178 [Hypoxylon sp. FL0543]
MMPTNLTQDTTYVLGNVKPPHSGLSDSRRKSIVASHNSGHCRSIYVQRHNFSDQQHGMRQLCLVSSYPCACLFSLLSSQPGFTIKKIIPIKQNVSQLSKRFYITAAVAIRRTFLTTWWLSASRTVEESISRCRWRRAILISTFALRRILSIAVAFVFIHTSTYLSTL